MKNALCMKSLIAIGTMLCIPFSIMASPLSKGVIFEKYKASCDCTPPEQGPTGPAGQNNFLDTFGSFYTLFNEDEQLNIFPIELNNTNVNLLQLPPFEVEILVAGTYFIQLGVSSDFNDFFGSSGLVALFRNDVEVPGTRFRIVVPSLVSIATIVHLEAGDVLFLGGFSKLHQAADPGPVSAYIDLIKIGS